MQSKLQTYNFAESPICSRYTFKGNPQSSTDVLEFIEKQINDIFYANTDKTNLKRNLTITTLDVIGQFLFVFYFFFYGSGCGSFEKKYRKHKANKKQIQGA